MFTDASKAIVLGALQSVIMAGLGLLVAFGVELPNNADTTKVAASAALFVYSGLVLWKTITMRHDTERAATTTTGLPKPE